MQFPTNLGSLDSVCGPAQPFSQSINNSKISLLIHQIAHDIGNPLTSIISFSSILERFPSLGSNKDQTLISEKLPTYAKSINEEAWKINILTESLVYLLSTRTDSASTCEIGELLNRACDKITGRLKLELPEIDTSEFDSSLGVLIEQDQGTFIFFELLLNALGNLPLEKKAQNQIKVISSKDNDKITLRVVNKIQEIPKHSFSDFFNPFVKFPEDKRSTGLGLTVCQAITERFKGSIAIEIFKNNSEFYFSTAVTLPADKKGGTTQSSNRSESSNEERLLPEKVSILIIEDEENVASAIQKILAFTLGKKCELTVTHVYGKKALAYFESGEIYNIILCDLNLRDTNGREIYSFVCERSPKNRVAFAFLTGDQTRSETKTYLASTGRPFLLKPFEPEELFSLIFELLDSSAKAIK